MPDQLSFSLQGRSKSAALLRGFLKANLVHHLAHTGSEKTLLKIGKAWKPTFDWLPPGSNPQSNEKTAVALFRVCAISTGDLKASDLKSLESIVQADPSDLWAWIGLGLNCLRLWNGEDHFKRALACFEKAVALAPGWSWAYLLRGEALRSLLEYERSLADYERAIALEPDLAWAYAFKARVLFQSRTDPSDMRWMDKAIAMAPGEGWLYAWRAEGHRRLGKLKGAEIDFRKCLKLDPLYDQAYCWRAKLLDAQGRHAEAIESLKKGLKLCPDFEKAQRQLVRSLRGAGRTDEALAALDRAAALNHRNDWLGNWRVEGAADGEAARQALAELGGHLARRPGDARARAWRGETLGQLGRHVEALADLDAALAVDAGLAWVHVWRGESLLALSRPEEALAAFDRGAALDPAYGRALIWRGRAQALAGRFDLAVADFDAAEAARRVEYAWTYAWRGQAKLELGRVEEALRDLDAALLLDPHCRQSRFWRSKARARRGDVRGAREDLLRTSDETFPWAAVADSEEHRRAGRFTQAQEALAPVIAAEARRAPWLYLLRYRLKREGGGAAAARDVDLAFRGDPGCGWLFGLAPLPEAGGREAALIQDQSFAQRKECSYVYAYLGQAKLARGLAAEGLADLERAAALEPAGWVWAWLGEAERQGGRLESALKHLSEAIRLDPRYANAYGWRGTARLQRGDAAGAREDLDRALTLAPTARGFLDRSRARRRLGEVEGALDDLARAARLNGELGWDRPSPEALARSLKELEAAAAAHPREARLDAWRGETLLRLGRPQEALAALDSALRKSPRLAWAFAWRAEARLALGGCPPEALRDARRAAALDGRYARAHEVLADVLQRRGDDRAALATLGRAVKLNPYSARLQLGRAKLELRMGRRAKALACALRALKIHPGHVEALDLRRVLLGEAAPADVPGLKSLEFFVNYACNAKCPFCFNPPDASPELERGLPFGELARRMYQGYAEGYRAIKFIGGEVTVREDLPKILGLARRIGFKSIQITTNGIRLADPGYAKMLVALGADSFRFSVHSHIPSQHDELVAVPGAFEKLRRAALTLKGLGVRLGINYVLNRVNYRSLPETCAFFWEELGVQDMILYFLRYQGFAALPQNEEKLRLTMSEAVPFVRQAFRRLEAGGHRRFPTLIHFPPCMLPELEAHMLDWTKDPVGCGQSNTAQDRMTLPDGSGGLISEVTNSGKVPVAACAACAYQEKCLGVEKNYVRLFGEAEFAPLRPSQEAPR